MDDKASDVFTKKILTEYFEGEKLKTRWQAILDQNKFSDSDLAADLALPKKKTSLKLVRNLLILAACFILLFLVKQINIGTSEENTVHQLLAEHYAKPYNREVFKGIDEGNSKLEYQAFQNYQSGEYEKAIPFFEEIILSGSEDEDVRLFLGLCYLYSNNSELAINNFTWILNQNVSSYEDAATWYSALAYTDAERYEEAKKYLIEVASWDQNSGRRKLAKKAKDLLKAME